MYMQPRLELLAHWTQPEAAPFDLRLWSFDRKAHLHRRQFSKIKQIFVCERRSLIKKNPLSRTIFREPVGRRRRGAPSIPLLLPRKRRPAFLGTATAARMLRALASRLPTSTAAASRRLLSSPSALDEELQTRSHAHPFLHPSASLTAVAGAIWLPATASAPTLASDPPPLPPHPPARSFMFDCIFTSPLPPCLTSAQE